MARLVIDSSVAIKWFVQEPLTAEAQPILDAYQNGRVDFLAPDLMLAEFGNIVWKKQTRAGLTATDAQAILRAFRALNITVTPTSVLLDKAYEIAVTYQRTVYDALYITLSISARCEFITADEKLVNAVSNVYPNVRWLGSLTRTELP